jgi:hypothetical protein
MTLIKIPSLADRSGGTSWVEPSAPRVYKGNRDDSQVVEGVVYRYRCGSNRQRRRVLTWARLEWIWSRAPVAYYFTNEHNTASIRMHETLNFRPEARFSEIRGVTANDGRSELILFEASRSSTGRP